MPIGVVDWRPTWPPVVMDLLAARASIGRGRVLHDGRHVAERRQGPARRPARRYQWSKHGNFLRIARPARARRPPHRAGPREHRTTRRRSLLRDKGWRLTGAHDKSRDTGAYQEHVYASRGEFTVAKDLVARTRSGWFSDRSVCYLAAGKPVVTQETGFSRFLPTGRGLFAFDTQAEAAAALDEIDRDYAGHSHAAHDLAAEYFDSDRVLAELCREAGL